jgi:hypothetical protein
MHRGWTVMVGVVLLTLFTNRLSAQPTLELIGNNIDVSSGLTVQRLSPSVAYNSSNNEYMVVWFDLRNVATTGNDVFAQRLSVSGGLLGANIPIVTDVGAQFNPFVAYNSSDNNYLVAWQSQFDGPGSPDFNDVFGRLVSSAGVPLGGAFHISDGGSEISIAYNSASNEYLTTGRSFASGPIPGIFGQIISNGGFLIGTEIVINTAGASAPNGQIIYNPTINEYFSTWRDQVEGNLKGQRISATGVLLGNPIIISPVFPQSSNPTASIAFDPANNRYLIVFSRFQGTDILGQFVASSGGLIGSNFLIRTASSPTATPSVAHSSIDNVFLLVWNDSNDILGQLLSETGQVIGTPLVLANQTAAAFLRPTTVHNTKSGDFLVAWSDNRNVSQGEQDIFAQLVGISRSTTLTYTGATSGDFHDSVHLSARLTLDGSSTPIANQMITFAIGTQSCTGNTDASGLATCHLTLSQIPGSYTVSASFAAAGLFEASNASALFTIRREETTLSYTGDLAITIVLPARLSGVLLEDGLVPIPGRSVIFTLGTGSSAQTCTGVTDAAGIAACTIFPVSQPLGLNVVTDDFAGDAFYLLSSHHAATAIFPP